MVRPGASSVKSGATNPPSTRCGPGAWIVVGLGSNLGDRKAHLARARASLTRGGFRWTLASSIVETDPVGPSDQPRYLNQVLAARPSAVELSPDALLRLGQQIERNAGRTRTRRWGARTIDVDILLWGERVIRTSGLTIPHLRMTERDFVLQPMSEILPDVVHPPSGRTASELWADWQLR